MTWKFSMKFQAVITSQEISFLVKMKLSRWKYISHPGSTVVRWKNVILSPCFGNKNCDVKISSPWKYFLPQIKYRCHFLIKEVGCFELGCRGIRFIGHIFCPLLLGNEIRKYYCFSWFVRVIIVRNLNCIYGRGY